MATFEIAVWETKELYDSVGYQAQTRVEEYLEGAIDTQSEHSVNVLTPSDVIGAPTEEVQESFDAKYPCDRTFTITYDGLLEWWVDVVDCNISDSSEASDANFLLTNSDGQLGNSVGDYYSVAEGGPSIANLPSSYDLYGCSDPYDSMQTALHEIGHCLMDGANYDPPFEEHEVGNVYDHNGTKARTPFARTNMYNECDSWVEDHDGCDEMRYSECCESKMENI